jgi:hypothetical protein
MEENLDKLFDYRALIPGSGRFASIVGIGGGAGRVVDQIHIPEHTRSLSGSLLGYKTIP